MPSSRAICAFGFSLVLGELHCFVLKLSSKTWLWFWHHDLLFKNRLPTFYHSTKPGEDQNPLFFHLRSFPNNHARTLIVLISALLIVLFRTPRAGEGPKQSHFPPFRTDIRLLECVGGRSSAFLLLMSLHFNHTNHRSSTNSATTRLRIGSGACKM